LTDVALKEHLEGLLSYLERQQAAHWVAHNREHILLKEAIDAAHAVLEGRLEAMNEFRTQIQSERHEFLKKGEYDIHHDQLEKRVNKLENANSNLDGRFWMLGSVLTGVSILLPLLLNWLLKR